MDEFWGASNMLSITGYLHYLNTMEEAGPINGKEVGPPKTPKHL